jgi:hypothetical protein
VCVTFAGNVKLNVPVSTVKKNKYLIDLLRISSTSSVCLWEKVFFNFVGILRYVMIILNQKCNIN